MLTDLLSLIDVKKIREYESLLHEAKHLAATTINKPFNQQDITVELSKETLSTTTTTSVNLPDSDLLNNNLRGIKTDLIIGMAQNTDPKNLAVFCKSIREVNKDVEVILFVNTPIPALHTKIANDNRIILKGLFLFTLLLPNILLFLTHSLNYLLTHSLKQNLIYNHYSHMKIIIRPPFDGHYYIIISTIHQHEQSIVEFG